MFRNKKLQAFVYLITFSAFMACSRPDPIKPVQSVKIPEDTMTPPIVLDMPDIEPGQPDEPHEIEQIKEPSPPEEDVSTPDEPPSVDDEQPDDEPAAQDEHAADDFEAAEPEVPSEDDQACTGDKTEMTEEQLPEKEAELTDSTLAYETAAEKQTETQDEHPTAEAEPLAMTDESEVDGESEPEDIALPDDVAAELDEENDVIGDGGIEEVADADSESEADPVAAADPDSAGEQGPADAMWLPEFEEIDIARLPDVPPLPPVDSPPPRGSVVIEQPEQPESLQIVGRWRQTCDNNSADFLPGGYSSSELIVISGSLLQVNRSYGNDGEVTLSWRIGYESVNDTSMKLGGQDRRQPSAESLENFSKTIEGASAPVSNFPVTLKVERLDNGRIQLAGKVYEPVE